MSYCVIHQTFIIHEIKQNVVPRKFKKIYLFHLRKTFNANLNKSCNEILLVL